MVLHKKLDYLVPNQFVTKIDFWRVNYNMKPEQHERQLVRFDWAMKNILRDKANFDILDGFLSELLQEQIKIDRRLEDDVN